MKRSQVKFLCEPDVNLGDLGARWFALLASTCRMSRNTSCSAAIIVRPQFDEDDYRACLESRAGRFDSSLVDSERHLTTCCATSNSIR